MDAASPSTDSHDDPFPWIREIKFSKPDQARECLRRIWHAGAPADLLETLRQRLLVEFPRLDDVDAAVDHLSRFVVESRSPTSLLALFERDADSLPALLQVFSTSESLADQLIMDPESFDLIRASDGQPTPRRFLVDELSAELDAIDRFSRAAIAIRKFTGREILRIAYGEFVREMTPEMVGRQLAYVADAVLEAGLSFVIRHHTRQCGVPDRIDGTTPEFAVIGLGNFGGEELSYGAPLKLLFLCDQIDRANDSHVAFYEGVVLQLSKLLCPEDERALGIRFDLSDQPGMVDASIFGLEEALQYYEASNRVWQRMHFVKARAVAGSKPLGTEFLERLQPWIYRAFLNRADLGEIRALRHKLERRAERPDAIGDNVDFDPGGRQDVEQAVQFLQLLNGHDLPDVRQTNTQDALVALEKTGCITHQEATLLRENYARLCRLEHQLSMMFDHQGATLPGDRTLRRRIAWRLGLRSRNEEGAKGDLPRFEELLQDTFRVNRRIINHLMVDAPHGEDEPPIETELLLDPDPDPQVVAETLRSYGLDDPASAMEDLTSLATECFSFLPPRRCRHFLSLLAPSLLTAISATPDPPGTLNSLVRVADSLGGKATLWELFRANPPTMRLVIRLCAAAPYLSGILVNHPGMIDELLDSLLMDSLPPAERLDAQSIELCRAAEDIGPILQSFKNSAHLTVGVRDLLGKEPIEATHRALSDTAEACLRRIVEHEQEKLAQTYGDPTDDHGEPCHLVVVALGKFGGREPNYHSNLDAIFLYTAEGQTRRRVGGPRSTTTNKRFFQQLTERVLSTVAQSGPLYRLECQLRSPDDGAPALCTSLDGFLRKFRLGVSSPWQQMALCRARCFVGPRAVRDEVNQTLRDMLRRSSWHSRMVDQIRESRLQTQHEASNSDLKRGEGGTLDVEALAQMLTIQNASNDRLRLSTRTTESLQALAEAGIIAEEDALALIANYRILRRVEANICLMNAPRRHELPADEAGMLHLAFLMDERDPAMILAQCQNARRANRRIFDQLTLRDSG